MKTIVITGATSGIGNFILKEFIKQGCVVFAGYRNLKSKKDLESISPNVIPFKIDLSKEWTINEAIKFINEKTEKIDTLVNAAGCVCAGPMECLGVDKIKEQFEVNTFSHLRLAQGLFEKLAVSSNARIINISSMASFGVFPFVAPYCASKRALDILFNSMQIECWGKNIGKCGDKYIEESKEESENGSESDLESELIPSQNVAKTCGENNLKVISIKPGVVKTPLWEKSIETNKDVLGDDGKYQKEFDFLMKNAGKNKNKGLDPQKVAEFIVKIEGLEKPKPSYTIGFDAKCAEILSHLPQSWINFIVRKTFEKRCGL